jgi:hypothetical protein
MKDFENAIEQAYWEYDSMKANGTFSERDCFKMVCRGLLTQQLLANMNPQHRVFDIDTNASVKDEVVTVDTQAETETLYVLVSDSGDGSYAINFTMNSDWIDAQQEAYENGDVDFEYGIGIDGDGFSYSEVKVPKGSTLKSLGITYDCADAN